MYKFIYLVFAIALAMLTTGCTASYQHMTLNQPANVLYPQSEVSPESWTQLSRN